MSIFAAPNFYSNVDRQIYNAGNYFIPQERFRDSAFNITPPATATGGAAAATGINTVLNQGGGGGRNPFTGGISDLTGDFRKTVDDRQANLAALIGQTDVTGPDAGFYVGEGMDVPQGFTLGQKIQNFAYDNIPFINRPQTAEQILAQGYQAPEFSMPGLTGFLNSISRFNKLPRGDQAFIARNTGYRGPTVFGENTGGGNVDPFGLNVTSGFGNYAERVGVEAEKLTDLLSDRMTQKYGKGTSGISFNAATGKFEADDETDEAAVKAALKATQMNKMNIAKQQFYTAQTKQRDLDRRAAEERIQRQAEIKRQRERRFAAMGRSDPSDTSRAGSFGRRPGSGGTVDRVTSGPGRNVDDTGQAYDSGGREGFGFGLADGGRVPYMMGGLTDLVDIYD